MNCSCCGKRKGLFESYEELDEKVFICVNCSKKLYKYKDFVNEKNDVESKIMLNEIKNKKMSPEFVKWLESFVLRIQQDSKEDLDKIKEDAYSQFGYKTDME